MKSIIFDCERMRYDETGIYYYCLNIAKRIRERLNPDEQLVFYTPSEVEPVPGKRIYHRKLHKLLTPSLPEGSIWHSTYQHSDYLPSSRCKVPVLLTIHDLNFMYDERIGNVKKERYLSNLQKRINRADALVCVSEHSQKDVLSFCNRGDKPMYVIHNGKNELEEPALSPGSFRPARPFLFSLGALRRKKNFHALIPLIKHNACLDLVIAGKAEEMDYVNDLRKMAKREGLEERIHLVGTISEAEKSWYYNHCTAFALASLAEGFSLPLVEAMSVGKPVFLSDKTALPEIGGSAAFYFSDFSDQHMQETFLRGLERYNAQNMTDRIKARANDFSWDMAADQYMTLYRKLNTQR